MVKKKDIRKASVKHGLDRPQLTEEELEEKVRQELADHYLTKDHLTKEELEELREEVRYREQGGEMLDGFWANPEFIVARQVAVMNGEWPKKEDK